MNIPESRVYWAARGVPFTTDTIEAGRAILGAYSRRCDVRTGQKVHHGAMPLFALNEVGEASPLVAVQSNAWHRLLGMGLFELEGAGGNSCNVVPLLDEKACNAALDALEYRRGKGGPARRKLAGLPPKPRNPKA